MTAERSKQLSYLLRHKPEKARLTLDKEGWVELSQLLANTDFTLEELEQIVEADEKGRYSFFYWKMGGEGLPYVEEPIKIRANQGHTTGDVKLTFRKSVPPIILWHGTTRGALPTILKEGLKPMKRHHVHLSAHSIVAKQVGDRRKQDTVILQIDTIRALKDGVVFYVSDNGVWLADYIDPKYIVTQART